MARNYGLGLDKLVDEDTAQWRQQGNAPGWASGYSFGKGVVEDFQRGSAARDAAEASTAAQQEQRRGGEDNTPIDKSFYTRNAADNYQLTPEQQQAVADSGDAYVPNNGEVVPTYGKDRYGLGANPTSFRDTPYTAAEKRQAGLQAMADSYGQSKAPGSAARAEYYNNRIEAATDRVEEAKDRDTRRVAQGLQNKAAQLTLDNATTAAAKSTALDKSMTSIVPIGGYVDAEGNAAKQGEMGAVPQTQYQYMKAVSKALTSGGLYSDATKWGMEANTELNKETLRLINKATNLDELNSTAYAQFNNGKDFVATPGKNGSTFYGHKGETPIFESAEGDKNSFIKFKDYLKAQIDRDPNTLSTLHDNISKQNMEMAKIRISAETKKEIAALRAEVQRSNVKETPSQTIDAVANGYAYAAIMALPEAQRTPEVKAALLRDGYRNQMRGKASTEGPDPNDPMVEVEQQVGDKKIKMKVPLSVADPAQWRDLDTARKAKTGGGALGGYKADGASTPSAGAGAKVYGEGFESTGMLTPWDDVTKRILAGDQNAIKYARARMIRGPGIIGSTKVPEEVMEALAAVDRSF
jgi:hypothetical protein